MKNFLIIFVMLVAVFGFASEKDKYVVPEEGKSIAEIARELQTDRVELMKINEITSVNVYLEKGTELKIPVSNPDNVNYASAESITSDQSNRTEEESNEKTIQDQLITSATFTTSATSAMTANSEMDSPPRNPRSLGFILFEYSIFGLFVLAMVLILITVLMLSAMRKKQDIILALVDDSASKIADIHNFCVSRNDDTEHQEEDEDDLDYIDLDDIDLADIQDQFDEEDSAENKKTGNEGDNNEDNK